MRLLFLALIVSALAAGGVDADVQKRIDEALAKAAQMKGKGASPEQLAGAFGQKAAPTKRKPFRMVDTVFYLLSTSVPRASVASFMDQSAKVAKAYDVRFYGVVRGFPKDGSLKAFFDDLYTKEREGFMLKMHPAIFKAAGVSEVPAYLFAECPAEGFRFRACRLKYLVRGDVTLSRALRIAGEKDDRYKIYRGGIFQ